MKKVHVLGPGCAKCEQLLANVKEAAEADSIEISIEKVAEPMEIAKFGVMFTPGLVIDGEVVVSGRLPSVEEIRGWLESTGDCSET